MKTRAWCFTLNNYNDDEERILRELTNVSYIIVGREVGELGTPHLQGYIYFKNARWEHSVKRILRRAHWEEARSDSRVNRNYCQKQGNFWEAGVIPMERHQRGKIEQDRWKEAWDCAKKGDIDGIDYDIRFRSYNTIKTIAKDYMDKPPDLSTLDNYWVWGPPGVGKSRSVRMLFPEAYFKPCSKWWDGYQHEDNIIIDDFELDHKCLGHHLKIWGDRYSFIAESKGSAMNIRPRRIVVTSNYSIEEVFAADQTMVQAIKRRFKQQHVVVPIPFPEPAEVEDPQELVLEDIPTESLIVPTVAGEASEEIDFSVWDFDGLEHVEV